MGQPVFTEQIETAAVQFDNGGDFVRFLFNPKFWDGLSAHDKLFVICHEALHLILNHGVRIKDSVDREACNKALDIVVNHMLVRSFGFIRENIKDWKDFCWVDTIFKTKDGSPPLDKNNRIIPTDESFEYYINLFKKMDISDGGGGSSGSGKGKGKGKGKGQRTVDDHSKLGENAGDEVIDQLDKNLADEDKETLQKVIGEHFQPGGLKPGTGTGGQWHFVKTKKLVKRKWETIIKKWSVKYLKIAEKFHEQWSRLNRRFLFLPNDLFLPSEMEIDIKHNQKGRIQVYFYMDTSGSCWHMKDRFFQAAESLPKDKFDVRLFCFDTVVQETKVEAKRVYGGGGTSFGIIEESIQEEIKKGGGKYPEAIFIATDGEGTKVNPEKPEKWHWLIASHLPLKKVSGVGRFVHNPVMDLVPKQCNLYDLQEFE